ncbi:MAG: class I SAM-dependent methyltransferase [Actinomycetota bacterium]|nr:class I SAM-dependent methyltransferase [Actinomycetota bacterium]
MSATDATLWLQPNRERSLQRRHPWIFSGGVARVQGSPAPGDTVLVRAADGSELGWAAYSPESQIRARMWTFDPSQRVTPEFIAERVAAAAARRAPLLGGGANAGAGGSAESADGSTTDSARLVFSEADGVPGLIADRYGDTVVCQLTTAGADAQRELLADSLAALPGVDCVFERSDADVREREGLPARVGLLRGHAPASDLVAHEQGFRFAVEVEGGHKTGFYLDQRDARAAVAQWAPARRVLNVFSYTGAFSVVAAARGAAAVTSIDSSGPALAVAARNGALNGVDIGQLMEADAFTALRGLRDRAQQYDLILLDPPKLANTERQLEKASRAYKDLNLLAVKLLAPGGVLMTWSCSGAMSMDLFQKVVAGAALDAGRAAAGRSASGREVRIIGRLHQPSDHPVPLSFPEAEYLKGLVLQAD